MTDEPLIMGPTANTVIGLWRYWAGKEYISCSFAGCKNHPRALVMGLATPYLVFFLLKKEKTKGKNC